MNKRTLYFLCAGLVALFLLTRFAGLHQIYHQDEYRWAAIAQPGLDESVGPHPPLTRIVLRATGLLFGFDNLRIAPVLFSLLNLVLIYAIARRVSNDRSVGLVAAALFTIVPYALIASLMIDIDGVFLPFFILLSYLAYLHIRARERLAFWIPIAVIAVVGGFLTKLSYTLFLLALGFELAVEFWFAYRNNIRRWLPYVLGIAGAGIGLGVLAYVLFAAQFQEVLTYAFHFKSFNFASRSYGDMGFKLINVLTWTSPLLIFGSLSALMDRAVVRRYRIWIWYLIINLVFYLVLFDFTTLTIERYFMFLILPLIFLSVEPVRAMILQVRKVPVAALIVLVGLVCLLLLPHTALPLNPKSAYLEHVQSLKLNFLIPFSGGSGPAGFYFSALFLAVAWMVSGIAWVRARRGVATLFLVVSIGSCMLISAEYLWGTWFGSVPKVARAAVEYTNAHAKQNSVITYYDIGAYDLTLAGVYWSRFYTAPGRDYTEKMTAFRGTYMIVDFPAIGKENRYWPLITRCPQTWHIQDKAVNAYVFDCSALP